MAHPSILDGIPRDIKNIHFYKHCDVQHLEDLLHKHNNQRALIITDGLFALTGKISPLNIVRITVSVNHTREQMEELLVILKQWRSKHGVT